MPPGRGLGQPALGVPAWAGRVGPPEAPSSLSCSAVVCNSTF